jgi:Ser-tRNA(Ala) deacylase AlaX
VCSPCAASASSGFSRAPETASISGLVDIDLRPGGGMRVRSIAEIAGIRVPKLRSERKRNKPLESALGPHSEINVPVW